MQSKVTAATRFFLVFVFSLVCLWLALVVLPLSGQQKRERIISTWTGRFLVWMGIPVTVRGDRSFFTPRPGEPGCLLVSNHISFLDIFVLDSLVPVRFIAKDEIAHWPVFGIITRSGGTIYIKRGDKRSLLATMTAMQKTMQSGRPVLMFPEGTTSDGTGLLRLHANLFEPAVRAHAQVVPVVLRYLSNGNITTRPAYTGNVGLFQCLWNILNTPNLSISLDILPAFTGEDRHILCRRASAAMSRAIGVADPLGESADGALSPSHKTKD